MYRKLCLLQLLIASQWLLGLNFGLRAWVWGCTVEWSRCLPASVVCRIDFGRDSVRMWNLVQFERSRRIFLGNPTHFWSAALRQRKISAYFVWHWAFKLCRTFACELHKQQECVGNGFSSWQACGVKDWNFWAECRYLKYKCPVYRRRGQGMFMSLTLDGRKACSLYLKNRPLCVSFCEAIAVSSER